MLKLLLSTCLATVLGSTAALAERPRSRPLSAGQERLLFAVLFGVGALCQLAAVLWGSGAHVAS